MAGDYPGHLLTPRKGTQATEVITQREAGLAKIHVHIKVKLTVLAGSARTVESELFLRIDPVGCSHLD